MEQTSKDYMLTLFVFLRYGKQNEKQGLFGLYQFQLHKETEKGSMKPVGLRNFP